MAGLSRQSLNGIEQGTVNATLDSLCKLLDVLGLALEVSDPDAVRQATGKPVRALWMAAKGANVSYSGELCPADLERALSTGNIPEQYRAQLAQVLDEAPLPLITKVVAEVAMNQHREPGDIWRNLRTLASTLNATRGGLWA